jgi:hypothetical protein
VVVVAGRPQRRARLAAGLPARQGNGVRPPFEHGNEIAVTHGALRADAVIAAEPRTMELLAWMEETAVVGAPCDHMTELRLAIVYRRIELATAVLEESDRAAGDRPVASYAGVPWRARSRRLVRPRRRPRSRGRVGTRAISRRAVSGVLGARCLC